jgi:hypothetical protein
LGYFRNELNQRNKWVAGDKLPLDFQRWFLYWYRIHDAGCRIQDTGYRMQDTGCRMQDAGYRIQDTGCRIQDTGYRMQDAGFKIQDTKFRIQDARYWIQDTGCRMPDSEFRIPVPADRRSQSTNVLGGTYEFK